MNIAGYARETPGRGQADTAFAQSERIRRWVRDSGNELIAICQDNRTAPPTERPGYRSLLEIVRSGSADAVLVATLEAISPDKVDQEIAIVDIRAAGATFISTDERDLTVLRDGHEDHIRLVVRDVVSKVADYRSAYGLSGADEPTVEPIGPDVPESTGEDHRNVVVELIAPTG